MTRSRIEKIFKEQIAPLYGLSYDERIRSDVSEPSTRGVFERCLRHYFGCHVNKPSSSAVLLAEEDTEVVYVEDQPLRVLDDWTIEYDEVDDEEHDRTRFWLESNGRILVQWARISVRVYPSGDRDAVEYGTWQGIHSATLKGLLRVAEIAKKLKELGFTGVQFLSDEKMCEHASDEYNIGRPVDCRVGVSRKQAASGVWIDEACLWNEAGREIYSIKELYVPENWSLDELQMAVEELAA